MSQVNCHIPKPLSFHPPKYTYTYRVDILSTKFYSTFISKYYMNFRRDINGLRAFAVIAVVLFHFNASWMPGGFAGVDVFFVISGFLMTGIIFRGIEQENLSILKFYVARANRIIPALALLCFVLLVFGWFYLTPLEYKALGKHAASSISFLSNFAYWREAGYFDAASHEKWLLHTWSLSVEWQFYIIYPLILVAMRKFMSINVMKLMLIVGTVLGFIFCVIASYKWPNPSYYLLPTRAWEMMIGGVAYLYPFVLQENRKKLVEWTGLALVVGSYFLISSESAWPGYLALFPVLGSFLIIQAQRNDSVITGNIIFQKIGSWSYSIYLWHWPFVVIIYRSSLPEYYIYLGIGISLFLGFLSYKYIEKIKFRTNFDKPSAYLKAKPLYISLFIISVGGTVFAMNGLYFRFNNEQQAKLIQIEAQKYRPDYDKGCFDYVEVPACTYFDGSRLIENKPSHILLGDSHAQSLVNALAIALSDKNEYTGLKFYGMAGCLFSENIDSIYPEQSACGSLARKTINEIIDKYPNIPIIYVNRLSSTILGDNNAPIKDNAEVNQAKLKTDLYQTLSKLSQGRRIYMVTPTPEFKSPVINKASSNYLHDKDERVKILFSEYKERNVLARDILNNIPSQYNVTILDVSPYFCDDNYCYGDEDFIPLYRDTNHVSEHGNKRLIPLFKKIL